MFSNRNGLIVDYNAVLWALMGKTARKLLLIQNYPQFSGKLSATNACMLATFSMSEPWYGTTMIRLVFQSG